MSTCEGCADAGWEAREQVRSIVGQIRAERQTLLFSATLPRKVEHLIRDVLSDPIRMTVGEVRTAMQKLRIVRLGFGTS